MPYPRQHSNAWFLKRWPYRIFMLRELSAVFLALYMVLLLLLVVKVHDSANAFKDHVETLRSPALIVFHVVALLFALLHSVTWFQAMPKGLPLRRGEEKVPPLLLIGVNYAVMLGLTAIVLAIVLV
jgi:fumarate reductase subunit C